MKMIYVIKDVEVKGLMDLKDLCTQAKRDPETKLSSETNIFMLKLLIEELGSSLVQKLCRKCKTANPISHCIYLMYVLDVFIVNIRKNCFKNFLRESLYPKYWGDITTRTGTRK